MKCHHLMPPPNSQLIKTANTCGACTCHLVITDILTGNKSFTREINWPANSGRAGCGILYIL